MSHLHLKPYTSPVSGHQGGVPEEDRTDETHVRRKSQVPRLKCLVKPWRVGAYRTRVSVTMSLPPFHYSHLKG